MVDDCTRYRVLGLFPRRNGIQRVQTDRGREFFYATADLKAPDLAEQAACWQHSYRWDRPHSSLGGNTPIDRVCELTEQTPLHEEVDALYDPDQERKRHPQYSGDIALRTLKRCR